LISLAFVRVPEWWLRYFVRQTFPDFILDVLLDCIKLTALSLIGILLKQVARRINVWAKAFS
jgi:hypothetical protein